MKRTDVIMNWYLKRSQKEAKSEADLLQALRDVAQLLAWHSYGESRGFSHRLLTPVHALRNAQAAIKQAKEVTTC